MGKKDKKQYRIIDEIEDIINHASEDDQEPYSLMEIKTKLEEIKQIIRSERNSQSQLQQKIDNFNRVLLDFAQHNYQHKIEINYDNYDLMDTLGLSINLLGEELNYSTVTKYYLQDIFNSMEDILIVIDTGGFLLSVNESAIVKLGFSKEELLQTHAASLFTDKEEFDNILAHKNKDQMFLLRCKESATIPVILSVSPFMRGDNHVIGSVIIAKDISQILSYQKKVEIQNKEILEANKKLREYNEELEIARKKAEESDKLKSVFLANVSHEIRTPLNSILGFSNLLLNNPDTDQRESFLKLINKSGNHLLSVMNDILDISLIEVNQITIYESAINLNELLLDIYNTMQTEINVEGSKPIQLIYKFGLNNDNSFMLADNARLKQVIYNLLNNAYKFTYKGVIEFGYNIKNQDIVFYVQDTGIGIEKDHFETIFMPFKQVQEGNTRDYQGTGLGLSICKALVERMNGKLWVESEPGKGSTFWFTIPFKATEKIQTNPSNNIPNLNSSNVLVVEDNEENFILLKEMLEKTNANIYHTDNGLDAVELILLDQKNIDLVFMDINIKGIDGYQATRLIKSNNADVKVIVQTAYAAAQDKEKAFRSGADSYIAKPIDSVDLYNTINSMLQQ